MTTKPNATTPPAKPTDPVFCILYARFSPRPNADTCDSCDSQLELLREWAAAEGWFVAGEYRDDALSGADHEREGLWEAIEALKPGFIFCVRDNERMARDTLFALIIEGEIRNKGARLAIKNGGGLQSDAPEAKLLRTILHSIAEYKRIIGNALTSVKMKRNQWKDHRRMSKELPFGWRPDLKGPVKEGSGMPALMEPDLYERIIIDEIVKLRKGDPAAGVEPMGLRQICKYLTEQGLKCRGRRWWHPTVRTILTREGVA